MFGFMVLNATFNNISVIAWSSVYWRLKPENPKKTIDLLQATDNPYHIVLHRIHLAMKGVLTLVVKGTDCTCSNKSNYNANMTTTVLLKRNLKRNNTYQTRLYNYHTLFGCLFVCLAFWFFLLVCLLVFLLWFFFKFFVISKEGILFIYYYWHIFMRFNDFHFTIGSFHWVLRFS